MLVFMTTLPFAEVAAETVSPNRQPPYLLNRADEDCCYLEDPDRRTDCWDPIKLVPLNQSGSWYLSLSGEA
jgi:hypothetical protein